MIRLLVFLAIAAGLTYCGATVKLGKRTFFGHVKAIWSTPEAQELKEGVKEKAGPAADRVKRGIEKGYEAATEDEPGTGSGPRKQAPAPAPAPATP
jgi:hypothetical protein